MSKNEKLLKAFTEIDNAVEISHATLAVVQEDIKEDRVSWVLIGVLEQLDKIREATSLIDEAMSGEAVTA